MDAPVRKALVSPLLSGSTLLALTYSPDVVQNALIIAASRLPTALRPFAVASWLASLDFAKLRTAALVWFILSAVRRLNRLLNRAASNSWRLTVAPGWDWPKEIAVITGGSSGIGKSTVEALVSHGIRVAILDVQPPPKILLADSRIRHYSCDVTSSESIAAAANAIRGELGHPTVLINNAGLTRPTPILQLPESFLRKIFGVNAMANWLTTQQFLPHMIERNKGHVVTVASVASFVALTGAADYSATKAAALAFHESLGSEMKHYYKAPNVLTTVVHPNFVRTPLVEDFADHLEQQGIRLMTSEHVAEQIVGRILSRRGGQLIIPESSGLTSGMRGWPTWVQELLRDRVGRSSANRHLQSEGK